MHVVYHCQKLNVGRSSEEDTHEKKKESHRAGRRRKRQTDVWRISERRDARGAGCTASSSCDSPIVHTGASDRTSSRGLLWGTNSPRFRNNYYGMFERRLNGGRWTFSCDLVPQEGTRCRSSLLQDGDICQISAAEDGEAELRHDLPTRY